MYKDYVLIYGKGGHASVVKDCLYSAFREIHSTDDTENIDLVATYPPGKFTAFVAIGNNQDREVIFERLDEEGYPIFNVIHSSAIISNSVKLGRGIYIGPHCVINAGSTIDDGVIINTAATVDHDCHIGAFTHIAPGANLCGHVSTGIHCLIGVGSAIIPGVKLGDHVIVGAGGAVTTKEVPTGSKLLGVPARTFVSESG